MSGIYTVLFFLSLTCHILVLPGPSLRQEVGKHRHCITWVQGRRQSHLSPQLYADDTDTNHSARFPSILTH